MNKLAIINCLRDSKKAHKALVNHVHALIEGLSLDEPFAYAQSLTNNADRSHCAEHRALSQLALFRMMEESKAAYLEIRTHLKVLDKAENTSLLGRLFGGNKVLELEKLLASHQVNELLTQIKTQTRQIVSDIDALTDKIVKMSDLELQVLLAPQTALTDAALNDNRHAA